MVHIEHFTFKPYRFPMARPFIITGEPLFYREGLILEIIGRDGCKGLGEAAPLPGVSQESIKKVIHQLNCLEKEWVGRTLPLSPKALCSRLENDLDRTVLAPSVVFALESAVISLAAASTGCSVGRFLGGGASKAGKSACLIQGDIETVRAFGVKYRAEGYSVFKLKVGSRNIPLDVAKVEALKEVIGFDSCIRLDANASWELDEAVAFVNAIGKGQIDFIEEPCRDQSSYETFFRRTDMPWAIEAHSSPEFLNGAEAGLGLKVVVVKPMLSSGINGFLSAKETAYHLGIQLIVSSVFETRIGLRMLANLASLSDAPCGCGTADWFGVPADGIIQRGGLIPPGNLVDQETDKI